MRRIWVAVGAAVALTLVHGAGAAVVEVTNLANSTSGASATLNFLTSRRAAAFTTDTSAASWTLDSITARMNQGFGGDSAVQLTLFSDTAGAPGTALETLGGNPTPSGFAVTYTFTSAGYT